MEKVKREIKFRAWDKEANKMYDDYVVHGVSIGSLWFQRESNKHLEMGFKAENYELMQYTGLKDKNEVEIYEGDVVKDDIRIHSKNIEVFWSDNLAMFMVRRQEKWSEELHLISSRVEVIGNIYENPELLKDDGV